MTCSIDARETDFSCLTNKLSRNIGRDLGRNSTFLSEDSIPLER